MGAAIPDEALQDGEIEVLSGAPINHDPNCAHPHQAPPRPRASRSLSPAELAELVLYHICSLEHSLEACRFQICIGPISRREGKQALCNSTTMNDAPPYSPSATSSELGRLPHDYQHFDSFQDDEDPLASLRRSKTASTEASTVVPHLDVPGPARERSRSESYNALSHAVTAPSTFFEPPPPEYAPIDALAHTFRLDAPLIYATKTSNTPRYQLMQEFGRSGRPQKLHIRRLMATEARSHSLPNSSLNMPSERLRYDEDGTMYTITSYEMRGLRSSTLGGNIKLETGGVLGVKWVKIWHHTKNRRRDSLNPENERRMQKYGYHSKEEWDKRLLFSIKKGSWEDGEGRQVAVEEGGNFEIVDERARETGWQRDLLVAAWVMRMWYGEGMRWENDFKGW